MATKTRVYDLGTIALAQQRKSHRRESEPPTMSRGSLLRRGQEMQQKHELDCYSDCGYPTRPRPKVILSVPRPGSAWSARHASKLQTVPVRVGQQQQHNGTVSVARQRAHRASIGSPFQGISSEKTNTSAERRRKQRRSVGADIESVGSVSESEESCISTVGYNGTSPATSGRALKAKVSIAPLEPPALTRVKKERLGLSLSWPSPSEDEGTDRERDDGFSKNIHRLPNEMSNRSRIQSRRRGDKEESPHGSSSRTSGKKSRKPSRALTFSFGSSSERVRKGLGYLHSKVTRRPSEESRCVPETHLAVPNSPILQSKRKSQTLPVISRSTEFQRHCIVEEERDSDSSQEDWGPDLTSPRRNRHTHKRLPPLKPLVINPSSSVPAELSNGLTPRTNSPAYSQNSEFSSQQDSMDSLSTSSPSSRQESPNMLTMPKQSKRERRKFSDPDLSDRDSVLSNGGEAAARGGGSGLKKRYTFCVRPTKQSPRPGWVSRD